jgi:hypothetical protein
MAGSMPEDSGSDIADEAIEETMERELDREGEPMEEEPLVIEDELITEGEEIVEEEGTPPSASASLEEELESAEDVIEDATDPTELIPDIPGPDEMPSGSVLGQAQVTEGGIQYTFTVVESDPGEYMFHLRLLNTTTLPIELSYATGERFNFLIFQGNNTVWSYNFNRFFMQTLESATIGPGKEINHQSTQPWQGLASDNSPLAPGTYRFEARHLSTDNPANLSFEAQLGN